MNNEQKKNKKYKFLCWSVALRVLSFIALILPMAILILVNKDEYFVEKEDVTKMTLGCILALITLVIMIVKKIKIKGLGTVVFLGILELIVYLLDNFAKDILIILPCAIVGYLGYWGINVGYTYCHDIYAKQRNARIDERARQETRNELREERLNNGNV